MALNSSSLRFTVEVAADQADKSLKALAVAFNQAGAQAKISMQSIAGASKAAGAEVVTLGDRMKSFAREQRQEARAVSFFVGELSQIAPVSGEAKMALSGIGQAMVGGLGIASGIGAAIAVVGALAMAFRNAAEEAKKIAAEIRNVEGEIEVLMAGGGEAGARVARDVKARAKEAEIAALRQELADEINSPMALVMPEELLQKRLANIRARIEKAQKELEVITLQGNAAITSAEEAASAERIRIAEREAAEKKRIAKETAVDIQSSTAGTGGFYGPRRDRGEVRVNPMLGLNDGLADASIGARGLKAAETAQAEYNRSVQESIALQQQWGDAIGNVFGKLVTGQMTAKQAIVAVGQMVVQAVTKQAVASITASAMKAGGEAASSQAGIPIVGPALAVAAMGAMISTVLGLLGNLPSAAAGWYDTGNYEGLMWIHKRERVLNAAEATTSRGGGGALGGVTVHISAMDGRSVERVLRDNDGALLRVLSEAARDRRTA